MSKDTGFSITSAERYSLALYELSNESNLLTQIEEQCSSVLELINTSDDFKNLIKDPTTKQDDLLKITNSISENYKFEILFKNFLNFLIQIKIKYKYDKSLIGGLVLQVGSTMVDTSIKNKLQQIENRMIEA